MSSVSGQVLVGFSGSRRDLNKIRLDLKEIRPNLKEIKQDLDESRRDQARPVQEYTSTNKTSLTALPRPTQSFAKGFQHGGWRWIFSTDIEPVQPSASRFAHRRRPNQPGMLYIYIYIYIYMLICIRKAEEA